MKQLIEIKCFQHKSKVIGSNKEPFRLYVIFRGMEKEHIAFNNIDWKPEFTNDDNLDVNYFEALPDHKLKFIQSNTF